MHTSGKVLAFLVVIAGVASTFLTAKLIAVQNSWTAKSQQFEQQYARTSEDLTKARKEFLALRDEIEATLREWGSTWTVDTQIANPAEGRLQIDAGTNFGLKDQMVIHGFQPLPDGSTIYRGRFTVVSTQADRSVVVPNWRLRPIDLQAAGDVPAWQAGNWRWRSVVPSGYSSQFDAQLLAFTKADETLGDRAASLVIQQRLVADAQRQLQLRNAELVGGPELPQDPSLSAEYREGLIAPLQATEESRNKELLAIDALREKVRQERESVQRLQAENLALTQKLPQPVTTLTERNPSATN